MTEHKATPEQWAQIELQAQRFNDDSCLIELRDRVEALEAQSATTATAGTDASSVRRRSWAEISFRGVTLSPPIDCVNPGSWTAERIYEMGFADGQHVIAHDASVTACSLVDELADVADPDDPLPWRGTCRLMLRQVAAWLREHGSKHQAGEHTAAVADLLEQEASR